MTTCILMWLICADCVGGGVCSHSVAGGGLGTRSGCQLLSLLSRAQNHSVSACIQYYSTHNVLSQSGIILCTYVCCSCTLSP